MGKIEVEVETKSSADKFWAAVHETHTLFPKLFPDRFKSMDLVEGDGKSAGSIFHVKYTEGSHPIATFAMEKVMEMDEANKLFVYTIIDGELMAWYTNLKASFQIFPKGDGGLVKWSLEYEKKSDEVPDPNLAQELAVKTITGVDEYLCKA